MNLAHTGLTATMKGALASGGAVLDLDRRTFLPPRGETWSELSITEVTETTVSFSKTFPAGTFQFGDIDRITGRFHILFG